MTLRRFELPAAFGQPCQEFACGALPRNALLAEKKKYQGKSNKDSFYKHKTEDANDILLLRVFFAGAGGPVGQHQVVRYLLLLARRHDLDER